MYLVFINFYVIERNSLSFFFLSPWGWKATRDSTTCTKRITHCFIFKSRFSHILWDDLECCLVHFVTWWQSQPTCFPLFPCFVRSGAQILLFSLYGQTFFPDYCFCSFGIPLSSSGFNSTDISCMLLIKKNNDTLWCNATIAFFVECVFCRVPPPHSTDRSWQIAAPSWLFFWFGAI